jgi:hypothetical protein
MTAPRVGLSVLGPALAFALIMSNYVCSSKAQIKPEAFHWTIDGSQVDLYTLKNSNGLEATITNYGGIVVSLTVPDKNGKLGDVVLATSSRNSKPLSGYTSRPVLAQSSESPGGSANLESAASSGRDRYGVGKRCHPYPYLSRRENYRNKIANPVQSSALP